MTEAGSTPTQSLDPWLECEPQLHGRLLEPLLEFYKLELGSDALAALATELGTNLDVLRDPDRWFSAHLFQTLIDAMVRTTGDPDITYRAGRAMAWASMMGPEKMLIRGFANPTVAFANINRATGRLSKITGWDVVIHKRGRATATALIADGISDSHEFCRNRIGLLEAIPEGFALPPARVHHPSCSHRGDDACVYECHWVERNPWLQRGWIGVGLLGLGAAVTALLWPTLFQVTLASAAFGALTVGVASAFSYRQVERDTREMTRRTVDKLQALLERNDRRIVELQAIQSITAAAVQRRDEEDLIDVVLDQLRGKLEYDRSLLLRVDERGERLGRARSSGFGEQRDLLRALDLAVNPDGDHPALFGHILREGQTLLVQVDPTYLESLLPHNRELLSTLGSKSFVAAPVVAPGSSDPLGLLVVDRTAADHPLNLYDRDLVGSVASMLGTAMSNVRQLRRVQRELLINQKFQQYLPGKAAAEILADPTARLRLGGQRRELAIMFTDMAGFTKASAGMSPERVVAGLNEWFKTTDPCISSCNGIVDKRMGDGILVVFLPEDGDRFGRHPVERAAAAAVQMLSSLEERRAQIGAVAPGFEAMEVRHAIHYGSAIVGNMGSVERMEYTVIGDAVNTCSRVETITPPGCIWLTGEAVRAVPGGLAGATLEKTVTLRGRESETEIWSLDPEAEATMSGTFVGMAPLADATLSTTTLAPEPDEV